MNTTYVLGGAGAVAILAAGFLLVIPPQQDQVSHKSATLSGLELSNQRTELKIPKLKEQLAGIAPQVDALRALAAKVPADINQSALLGDLTAAARQAGLSGISNMSISLPTLVKNAEVSSAAHEDPTADPAAPEAAATPAPTPRPTSTSAKSTGSNAAGSGGNAVIASYDVSLSATGTPDQVVAFLAALRSSPRLNVVSASSVEVARDGTATLTLTTRFFLQKVDVEGLAGQIESLNASLAAEKKDGPAPAATPTPQVSATATAG